MRTAVAGGDFGPFGKQIVGMILSQIIAGAVKTLGFSAVISEVVGMAGATFIVKRFL